MDFSSCYYCRDDMEDASREHIIPSVLGSNITVRNYMCGECNNKFGYGIEAEFARAINMFRVLFMLRSSDGRLPPPERGVECQNSKEYDFFPGGIPKLSDPSFERRGEDENIEIHATYRNWQEAKNRLGDLDEAYEEQGRSEKIINLVADQEFLGTCNFRLNFGGSSFGKVALKSTLNFLARINPQLLARDEFKSLAQEIACENTYVTEWACLDFWNKINNIGSLNSGILLNYSGGCYISSLFFFLGHFYIHCEISLSEPLNDQFCKGFHYNPFLGETSFFDKSPITLTRLSKVKELFSNGEHFDEAENRIGHILSLYHEVNRHEEVQRAMQRGLSELSRVNYNQVEDVFSDIATVYHKYCLHETYVYI